MKPITDIDDPRYVKALAHPLRIRILAMLADHSASPVQLSGKLDATLGTVAYHVRTLHSLGLVELVDTRQRRGATEHYYRAREHPRFPDDAWSDLAPVAKQRMLSAMLQQIGQYVTGSAAAGGFARGRRAGHVLADLLQHRAQHPLLRDRGQAGPRVVGEARMLACAVVVLGRPAPLARVDELDQAEAVQRSHVIGDRAERRVEPGGELDRARALVGEHREDADPQRVRQRFDVAGIVDFGDRLHGSRLGRRRGTRPGAGHRVQGTLTFPYGQMHQFVQPA